MTQSTDVGNRLKVPNWFRSIWSWVRERPIWMQLSGAAIALLGAVGFVFFLGFVSGERQVGPAYPILSKVTNKLDGMFFRGGPKPTLEATIYNSALVRLDSAVSLVDTGRDDSLTNPLSENGGGLTSFGKDVLVLAYNGKIYASSGEAKARATAIEAPDNNRAAYQALSDNPDFSEYTFHRGYLRYNDLIHVEAPSGAMLVASYTEFHPEEACYTNTLAKLPLPEGTSNIDEVSAASEDWEVLFRTDPCMPFKTEHLAMEGHMAGGRMVFQAPSTIVFTSGDFHLDGMRSDGPGIAQDPDSMYGKTIEVDVETGAGRVLSIGHRNAQGIAALPDGTVLVAEHGPRGGDELNVIQEGLNYGWPLESYGTTYRGTEIPNSVSYGRHAQFEAPIFAWLPSVAVSGMTVVDGFDDSWNGDLLVSSLVDQALFRVRMQDGEAIYDEKIEVGSRIRYVHQHSDGRIVLWTDNAELIFLSALQRVDEGIRFQNWLANADYPNRVKSDLDAAMGRCIECHSFQVGDHEKAPGLNQIFGEEIASTAFEGYSEGLSRQTGTWTRERLIAYLDDPQGFADSYMPGSGIEDDRVTQALVDYLEHLDQQF